MHALGQGLATALALSPGDQRVHKSHSDLNNRKITTNEPTPAILPISVPFKSTSQISLSNLSAPVIFPSQHDVMEMIDAYARAAVQLALQTWKRRQTHNASLSDGNKIHDIDRTLVDRQSIVPKMIRKLAKTQLQPDNILYDVNDEVVREWITFLRRI